MAELTQKVDSLLVLKGIFKDKITHPDLGLIRPGTTSYEYYWLDRWYNVFRFHEPDGEFRNYYCNINMPPTFRKGVLEYVDLDLDILVKHDSEIEILDREEFETNSISYSYPESVKTKAQSSLEDVIRLAENKQFPFNHI